MSKLVMQTNGDGNLVVYAADGSTALWDSTLGGRYFIGNGWWNGYGNPHPDRHGLGLPRPDPLT
ncbi:hypothetical protein ACWGI1_13150 [Streptomyces sp. NPDC054835]|uniref:hypothetical protein n=1 Tax=Streptomyces sp. NPDC092046 TaxID=3366009 RepID=UPI003821DD3D